MYQSGVRDLYTRLARHPGVAHRPATSPSYYSQVKPDWPGYLRELDRSVTQVGSTGRRPSHRHTTATTEATITVTTTATGRRGRAGCWARRRRSPSTSFGPLRALPSAGGSPFRSTASLPPPQAVVETLTFYEPIMVIIA